MSFIGLPQDKTKNVGKRRRRRMKKMHLSKASNINGSQTDRPLILGVNAIKVVSEMRQNLIPWQCITWILNHINPPDFDKYLVFIKVKCLSYDRLLDTFNPKWCMREAAKKGKWLKVALEVQTDVYVHKTKYNSKQYMEIFEVLHPFKKMPLPAAIYIGDFRKLI